MDSGRQIYSNETAKVGSNERQLAASALSEAYSKEHDPNLPDAPKINVSAAVSTLASFYERVRRAMEYREPHLLRRAATERILSRRLRGESDPLLVSEGLVRELIRGRYLENNHYPESLISEIGNTLEKYRLILHKKDISTKDTVFSFITRLASAEIEEFLNPPAKDDALAHLMLINIGETIVLADPNLNEDQKLLQLQIAVYKNLLKLDQAMIEFNIFELFYPYWKDHGAHHVDEVAQNIERLKSSVDKILNYPLSGSLSATTRRYSAPFIFIRDALEQEGPSILSKKEALSQAVSRSYERRASREKERIATTSTRALIYIFLTKAVLSFAFELPAERIIYGAVRALPLFINFLFPPFLLFLLTLSVSTPDDENKRRVVLASEEAVFGNGRAFSERNRVEIKKRSPTTSALLLSVYAFAFLLIFGGLYFGLTFVGFTPFAVALFIFYTSIVTYFGVKVRESSKELVMAGGRETLRSVVFDFLALPFLRVGSWVSSGLERFNVLVLFTSLIVEAPIQSLLEFLEEWIHFAREKKEEVY